MRLFAYVPSPPESHDALLLDRVAPLFSRLRARPGVDSLSFTRSSDPEWLLRVLVRGDASIARRQLEATFADVPRVHVASEPELPDFAREVDRWGGEEGLRIAERVFDADSAACLAFFEAERRGAIETSRREWNLVLTDRVLDLLRLDPAARREFYRRGFAWAIERDVWSDEDVRAVESRYAELRAGLAELLGEAMRDDPSPALGGAVGAAIAERFLAAARPPIEELLAASDRGALSGDLTTLVWGLAHLSAIRLGLTNESEAVLRYFAHRVLEDAAS